MQTLPELVAKGRRVLLFSQFTSMLGLIEAAVTQAKIPYVMLTGQTRDRASVVRRFQKDQTPPARRMTDKADNDPCATEAKRDLFADIEGYYNRRRLHPALGTVTPERAERRAA